MRRPARVGRFFIGKWRADSKLLKVDRKTEKVDSKFPKVDRKTE